MLPRRPRFPDYPEAPYSATSEASPPVLPQMLPAIVLPPMPPQPINGRYNPPPIMRPSRGNLDYDLMRATLEEMLPTLAYDAVGVHFYNVPHVNMIFPFIILTEDHVAFAVDLDTRTAWILEACALEYTLPIPPAGFFDSYVQHLPFTLNMHYVSNPSPLAKLAHTYHFRLPLHRELLVDAAMWCDAYMRDIVAEKSFTAYPGDIRTTIREIARPPFQGRRSLDYWEPEDSAIMQCLSGADVPFPPFTEPHLMAVHQGRRRPTPSSSGASSSAMDVDAQPLPGEYSALPRPRPTVYRDGAAELPPDMVWALARQHERNVHESPERQNMVTYSHTYTFARPLKFRDVDLATVYDIHVVAKQLKKTALPSMFRELRDALYAEIAALRDETRLSLDGRRKLSPQETFRYLVNPVHTNALMHLTFRTGLHPLHRTYAAFHAHLVDTHPDPLDVRDVPEFWRAITNSRSYRNYIIMFCAFTTLFRRFASRAHHTDVRSITGPIIEDLLHAIAVIPPARMTNVVDLYQSKRLHSHVQISTQRAFAAWESLHMHPKLCDPDLSLVFIYALRNAHDNDVRITEYTSSTYFNYIRSLCTLSLIHI